MISFPSRLTRGIEAFLHHKLIDLKKKEKSLKESDPFFDQQRTGNNSLEEDVDEQIGRFETEVKISFIKKQIVQVRKALTNLKIGKYGICEKCHNMIDTDRLAVKPDTTLCVKCAEDKES
ncbi:MAG TPA: TraR/DksA C4-type zinc finger protein [Candidatus Woesebacteria bacterium]|nr:TraR/DksA C4-type zinc finger protein [Candidatus Woesebacteria bacterium]